MAPDRAYLDRRIPWTRSEAVGGNRCKNRVLCTPCVPSNPRCSTRPLSRRKQRRSAFGSSSRASRTTRSSCSRWGASRPGTPVPSASRATRPTRSSASTSRLLSPGGRRRRQVRARARDRHARGTLRGRGLARPQGRHALLGQRHDHRAPRPRGRPRRLRQGHPRPDRAPEGGGGGAPLSAARRERQGLRDLHARPAGHVSTWNAGAERIKGYRAAEIIGKHFSVFYPPEDVAAGKSERELEIAVREGRFEEEGWRVRKDGSRIWANVTITALRDPEGGAHRLRQGHPRPDRAPPGRRSATRAGRGGGRPRGEGANA